MKRASLLTLTLIGAFSAIQAAWAVDYPLPPTGSRLVGQNQTYTGMYFALFGFAAIFFFSGAHVLPTAKNNKKAVARAWEEAQANLAHVLPDDFPLPARYAHPVVLTRMIRILREGRAQSADEALEVLKSDLKALNADVQVSQEEYDEVVAIKSMFLLSDYQ